MRDPFSILGVARDTSDDDVKKAYRRLARENHPDKFTDPAERARAEEKMKEINAAYDEIQKIRAGKATGTGASGGGYGYGDPYGGQTYQGGNPFITARQLINMRRVAEAAQVLAGVPVEGRGAEWHFLMGCIAVNRGHFVDAQQFFDTACGMDPDNFEYRDAQERLRNRGNGFGGGQYTQASTCSCCDICAALACLDCCCGNGCCH